MNRVCSETDNIVQVRTAMQQQWKEAYRGIVGEVAKDIGMAFGKSPEQGAYTALWVCMIQSPDFSYGLRLS